MTLRLPPDWWSNVKPSSNPIVPDPAAWMRIQDPVASREDTSAARSVARHLSSDHQWLRDCLARRHVDPWNP